MEQQLSPTNPFPLAADQETFQRVWRRVMPAEDSPIAVGPAAEPEPSPQPEPPQTAPEPEPSGPPVEAEGRALRRVEETPRRDVPCLGAASMAYAPGLREMMESAYAAFLLYQALARRVQGQAGRQLSALAASHQRFLSQLGTAYFLLTGQRFQPSSRPPHPAGALSAALREMFMREQRWRQAFVRAAQDNRDPCLTELFQSLGAECEMHLDGIRRVLERLHAGPER